MSDQAKFQKMLEVLLLLYCQYGRTIAELSERFEISQRTVYRYLDTFKQVGFVIENTNGYFKIDKENATVQEISHLLHFSKTQDYLFVFYVRRFLIQPLFLILFVPAFFYQKSVNKQ